MEILVWTGATDKAHGPMRLAGKASVLSKDGKHILVNDGRTRSLWTTGHDKKILWQETIGQRSTPEAAGSPDLQRIVFWDKTDGFSSKAFERE